MAFKTIFLAMTFMVLLTTSECMASPADDNKQDALSFNQLAGPVVQALRTATAPQRTLKAGPPLKYMRKKRRCPAGKGCL